MNMATLETINRKVLSSLGDPDGTNYDTAEVTDHINAAVKSIARQISARWPDFWLVSGEAYANEITLVEDQQAYDLDSDFYRVIGVDYPEEDEPYPGLDLAGAIAGDEGFLLTKKPSDGTKQISFYPTPDGDIAGETVTVYMVTLPEDVISESTEVPLSEYFEDLIWQMVSMRLKIRSSENAEGFAFIQRYVERELNMLITSTNSPDGQIIERGVNQEFI